MVFTAPIFTKLVLAQIVANIPVPNSFKIGRKMHKIRAKLFFLAEVRYGFHSPIFTKFVLAQIVANIPVPNSFKIGRKMHKIRAELFFLAEMRYGFYSPDFHETLTC
jgi:hypothetical protein